MWSIHAVAHVLEMQGRLREGAGWLSRPPDIWDDRNPMREHLWWHLAMFEIERGRIDEVLALYDGRFRAKPTDFYLDIQNCASMLWRLECRDVDVGERWEELAEACAGKVEDHALAFTEPHHVMALGRAGRFDDVERVFDSLEQCARARTTWAAGIARRVTLPLCRAVAACCRGDYGEATELLLPIRADFPLLGGEPRPARRVCADAERGGRSAGAGSGSPGASSPSGSSFARIAPTRGRSTRTRSRAAGRRRRAPRPVRELASAGRDSDSRIQQGDRAMEIGKAAGLLRGMYDDAPRGEKVTAIHLFGIKHAQDIESISPRELVVRADLHESYHREIRKMIKLAKYVKLK